MRRGIRHGTALCRGPLSRCSVLSVHDPQDEGWIEAHMLNQRPPHSQALKAEVSSQPHLLEASVFGYDDIYRRLRPFVAKWRQIKAQQPGARVRA